MSNNLMLGSKANFNQSEGRKVTNKKQENYGDQVQCELDMDQCSLTPYLSITDLIWRYPMFGLMLDQRILLNDEWWDVTAIKIVNSQILNIEHIEPMSTGNLYQDE